jgi:hypothetical protein
MKDSNEQLIMLRTTSTSNNSNKRSSPYPEMIQQPQFTLHKTCGNLLYHWDNEYRASTFICVSLSIWEKRLRDNWRVGKHASTMVPIFEEVAWS